jgi:alpha-tubulin suppressor-like RCC1 family protein
MPSENITLYAKWTINEYSISYSTVLLQKFINISSSRDFSLAITNSGKLYAWGLNESGQLGDGSVISRNRPTLIAFSGLQMGETIQSVSAGSHHSIAVTTNGRVYAWGRNSNRELGDGTTISKNIPYDITSKFSLESDVKITSLYLGILHSLALTSDGRVFSWGPNSKGQLGDGTTTERIVPNEITSNFHLSNGEKITSISLGGLHSTAITSTGKVFIWGWNAESQLGDGTNTDRSFPKEITSSFLLESGDKIITISLGTNHSSAISSNGRVFTWGFNEYGQLGDGTTTNKNVPIDITSKFSLMNNDKIETVFLGEAISSALSANGRVFTWGHNYFGQLGDGSENKTSLERILKDRNPFGFSNYKSTDKFLPVDITGNFNLHKEEKIISIILNDSALTSYSSAISSNGRVFMWGANSRGQLGDGTTSNKNIPKEITSNFSLDTGEMITSISLGFEHSSAISSKGRVFMWGANYDGQLGDGTSSDQNIPKFIKIE